jgi:hypothetical protein
MSKTTTINKVPIRDIAALHSAATDLKNAGVNCSLVANTGCRLWYSEQQCAYVLKLPDCQFDLGIVKNGDGTYSTVTDLHAGLVSRQIGQTAPPSCGFTPEELAIGKFMQEYGKHAAINAAMEAGHQVSGCYLDEQGEYQLELEVTL